MKQDNPWNALLTDPNFIAGVSRFNPGGEQPLLTAATLQRQQEEARRQQQEFDQQKANVVRQQFIADSLPKVLNEVDPKKPQEALQLLVRAGVPPKDALVMVKHLQELTDNHAEDRFNPVTGELVRFQDKLAQGSSPQQGMGYGAQLAGTGNQSSNPFVNTPVGQKQAYEEELAEQKDRKKQEKEFLKATSETAVGESKILNKLDSAEKLLGKFYQGTGAGAIKEIGKLANSEGSKAAQTFESIVNKLAIDLSANLKGAQSDRDMARVESTKPSLTNTKDANKSIIQELKAVADREVEYNKAAQEFVKQGGTPEQFKTRWAEYARAFPLIEEDGSVNEENKTLWKNILFRSDQEFQAIIDASKPVADKVKTPFGDFSQEELEGR